MKKSLIILAAMFCMTTTTVSAQEKGDMAAGVHLGIGAGDSFTNFGLGAKYQWNVIDKLRLEPSFTYYFEKDNVSMWDLNVNVHYQFVLGNSFSVYPLAGLSLLGTKVSVPEFDFGELGTYGGGSASDTEVGFNLGVGADYDVTEKIQLNAEAKYKIGGSWDRFFARVGVAYKF